MSLDLRRGRRTVLGLVTAHVAAEVDGDRGAVEAAMEDVDLADQRECAEVIGAAVRLLAEAVVCTAIAAGIRPEDFLSSLGTTIAAEGT